MGRNGFLSHWRMSGGTSMVFKSFKCPEVKRCGIVPSAGGRRNLFVERLALEPGGAGDLLGLVGGRLASGRTASEERAARMP